MSRHALRESSSLSLLVVTVSLLAALCLLAIRWTIYYQDANQSGHNTLVVKLPEKALQDPSSDTNHKDLAEVVDLLSEKKEVGEILMELPPSMSGLSEPSLTLKDSRLVIDGQLKGLFDHYLLLTGEESLETIALRIKQALQKQLVAEDQLKALAILENYLQYLSYISDYKQGVQVSMDGELNSTIDIAAIREIHYQIRAARESYFSSETNDAFFAIKDAYDDFSFSAIEINTAAHLSEQQREERLELLESEAPEWIRTQKEKDREFELFLIANEVVSDNGSNDLLSFDGNSIWESERIERLKQLVAEQDHWRNRVAAYRAELDSWAGTTEKAGQQLQALRQHHFYGPELLRIAALDSAELGI